MRHEDFISIQIEDVMARVLDHCRTQPGVSRVQWISEHGLRRVRESTPTNWQWAFQTTDMIGKHVIGDGADDLWTTYQMWKSATGLEATGPRLLPEGRLVIPVHFEQKFIGFLTLEIANRGQETMRLHAGLAPALEIAAKYIHFAYEHLQARNLSYLDEVTGLYNQRYLPTVLDHEINRSQREKTPFSLLFLDIDYFKMVNDRRGHWVGSKLLSELAGLLKEQVRSCDYSFRYGGDEFIVVLGGSNAVDSGRVAERIRKAVEEYAFEAEGQNLKLTVSIGVASFPEHAKSTSELIQLADQAMYYGKRKSRNIVFVAS